MASIIQELQKKQAGFNAAQKAIEETKPKSVGIEKKDDEENRVTVFYDPGRDIFSIKTHGNSYRYGESMGNITFPEAKLIYEALNELFTEAAHAS